jgi:hypothetical protein
MRQRQALDQLITNLGEIGSDRLSAIALTQNKNTGHAAGERRKS